MVVLIRNAIDILRRRERGRQIGCRSGFIDMDGDIIQTCRSSACKRLQRHLVGGLQVMKFLDALSLTHLFIAAMSQHTQCIHCNIVHADIHRCSVVSSHYRRHYALLASSFRRHGEGMTAPSSYRRSVIQVSATMIPGEVVNLIQGVIVIRQGIILLDEFRLTHGLRRTVVFRQEVIAVA